MYYTDNTIARDMFYRAIDLLDFNGGVSLLRIDRVQRRFHAARAVSIALPSIVTDTDALAIASKCSNVESVDAKGCRLLTDFSIVAFARSCLKSVCLDFCVPLTDICFGALAERCPLLESVSLRGCELTDVSIVALAKKCARLSSVNFAFCDLLTDVSIMALAGNSSLLESVNLGSCKLLTDVSIVAFAGSCPLLKSVNFTHCYLLTDASVAALKAALPDGSAGGP